PLDRSSGLMRPGFADSPNCRIGEAGPIVFPWLRFDWDVLRTIVATREGSLEMAGKLIAVMTAQGRLTLPAAARRALQLEGETQFEVEIEGGSLRLRPVVAVPREDLWAYTPEHLERVARARAQV